ncbi:MAG TPA: hypothetical protein PKD85_14665, partial [Saprospiraceae bacterium]|nr:hypothetical protein [Saprospiraceae bacterium]
QKIHSSSPFSVAFNFSLGSDKNKIAAIHKELKKQIKDENDKAEFDLKIKEYKFNLVKSRVKDYFINAKRLCLDDVCEELEDKINIFENFCENEIWTKIPNMIMKKNVSRKKDIDEWEEVSILAELKEKQYLRVYLSDIDLEVWDKAYTKYYEGEYPPNELKENDFISVFPDKKPFMTHRTASFETLKISGKDAKILKTFKDVLSVKPKVIPNPLPIFIYQDELQHKVIALFNDKEKKCGYKEMIETVWDNYKNDLSNYFLIDWYVGRDIVFQDFDFVPKFEYEFDAVISNHFGLKDYDTKQDKFYPKISNIFQVEENVFSRLIGSRFNKIDYFKDLDSEDYKDRSKTPNVHLDNTFQAYAKYRKAVYDFVYKSKRQGIDARIFTDMVFSRIRDDIKNNNEYSIKDKLNIWFSLYENFDHNKNNNVTMASKLKDYQEFVSKLAVGQAELDKAQDTHFAFQQGK